ncbi:hypothetical protein PFLUV_G00104480 [Perca fluviatilis]|uniref:Exocyst complex component 3-like protein n=1 Tax=Perca fluviatilis TaxID=8168 RepID=A0A6A5EZ51_PERFL|nr:hypothetical protein PFLUV_G00104480 [Perca fluviatilis]
MSAGDQKSGGDKPEDTVPVAKVWPEVERAECLARGAALKWASGVFCRPEHLERLSQYKKRESQRTASIHTRLKSMVQSYLEGVGWGLEQLREARAELKEVSHALKKAGLESNRNAEGVKSLERLREVSVNHRQLLAAVSNLPRLYSVRSMVLETERLVESRRLLEAHARLMDLERWQDDILWQLHGANGMAGSALSKEDQELVAKYFSGVGQLVDALGKELWAVVSSALALARQNPTPFVSAVRIVEREEALDQAFLEERVGSRGNTRPLPPGRPRCWRACFFQVLEEAVSARFRSVSYLHTRGPGLAGHLSALQHGIMADLATVRHLLEHCVPPHYQLTGAYLRASHRCLHSHLAQDLGHAAPSSVRSSMEGLCLEPAVRRHGWAQLGWVSRAESCGRPSQAGRLGAGAALGSRGLTLGKFQLDGVGHGRWNKALRLALRFPRLRRALWPGTGTDSGAARGRPRAERPGDSAAAEPGNMPPYLLLCGVSSGEQRRARRSPEQTVVCQNRGLPTQYPPAVRGMVLEWQGIPSAERRAGRTAKPNLAKR